MRAHNRRLASLEHDNRLLNEALATSRRTSDDGNQAALALSQAQTRIGLADLLVSEAALTSSQTQLRIGEANLLASEVALASSKAETKVGQADLLVSATALASSQAQTRIGLADLLASETALASSEAEMKISLADLLASAVALASSRAETEVGRTNLLASATELAISRAEAKVGQIDLRASAVANKALSLANGLLVTNEAALEESVKRLEQLAAFAAHDLRSPITSIVSGLYLIQRDCETTLGPKAKRYIDMMIESAHGLARQITSILLTAKAEHGDKIAMFSVNLNVVLEEIRFNLSELIQKTGAIIHVDQLPCLEVEPNLFRQLLQNLIENAINHRSEQLPIVYVQHEANIAENIISIRDNGCGIASKDAERVFGVFEQVQVARSGTGIGLALCRRVVDLHHGSISIDQNFKDGCRVVINIPILDHPTSVGQAA